MQYQDAIALAIDNVIHFGDTDIFPNSIENIIFEDNRDDVIEHFKALDSKLNDKKALQEYIALNSISNFSTACPVGFTGYRWATLIDPYWNLYFLSKVIQIAAIIEAKRLSTDYVYSYRFNPDPSKGTLFSKDVNWKKFQLDSMQVCEDENIKYVISCDIADFYPRIYHHRLENELERLSGSNSHLQNTVMKITTLMQKFSDTKSYGLPVGGPASRILAELALNAIDKLLFQKRVKFKRFVDDYLVFCSSKEEAHSILTELNIKLIENEGLTLQKNKSVIMSKEEFTNITKVKISGVTEDEGSTQKAKFLNLPIRYDPYSPNAKDDYEEIKESLKSFDLFSMLSEELKKSKVNQIYTKHILKALKYEDEKVVSNSLYLIFDNINELYPIYNSIVQATISLWSNTNQDTKNHIFKKLEDLHLKKSYIIQTDVNLAYTVKLISLFESDESLIILNEIMDYTNSALVKKMVTQAMGKLNNFSWLSDQKNRYSTQNELQKRIFIICSYLLGDEGSHWRTHNKKSFTEIQKLYEDWASKRKQTAKGIQSAL